MTKQTPIAAYSLADAAGLQPILARVFEHLRQPAYFTTALALYRRLQFGRFLDSSFLFTNLPLDSPGSEVQSKGPWFFAFVDRGCRPETEVWIFGSWEVERQHPINDPSSNSTDEQRPPNNTKTTSTDDNEIRTLLLALLRTIKTHPTPPSIHAAKDVLAAQSQISTSNAYNLRTPASHLPNPDPDILLFGAVHATTTSHLHALGLAATHLLPIMANHTFVFPLSTLPAPSPLPPTLRWGKLQKQHFPLVRSRTEIARQDFTLARLPNLAIFPIEPASAAPIAWAFVGLDGSLTSLHTEATHRRMGLAMLLTGKLLREEMGRFWEEGLERVAHGNVAVGNGASAGMCRRLGGRDVGEVFWVKVDLNAEGVKGA